MTDIFVSYKREDEGRVVKLVRALEAAGYSVWWDRGMGSGEGWRANIEAALEAARCVIVVWTRASSRPDATFVHDEAQRAAARNVLIPVIFDSVKPPLGFGEMQTLDLRHWRGRRSDPFFEDLLAAVHAKMEGMPVPRAKGPVHRLVRQLTYGSIASAVVAAIAAFGLDIFRVQSAACAFPLGQPALSDFCGTLNLGGRPARAERIAWSERRPGNCSDLKRHITAFPDGAYRDKAAGMLAARREVPVESWLRGARRLELFVGQDGPPLPDEAEAKRDAFTRAQTKAERLCRNFSVTTKYRFVSASAKAERWSCNSVSSGVVCGFEGQAVCELDERHLTVRETCGA